MFPISWWMWLAALLLVGSLLSTGGELALGMWDGTVEPVTGVTGFIGSWIAGFYHWDQIGVSALTGTEVMDKLMILIVVFVYFLMFRFFYKASWHLWDFFRRRPMVSRTRVKLMCLVFAVILMAIFSWGFAFPRALLEAVL